MNAIAYQIYFKRQQLTHLDEAFLPLDVSKRNNPRWCEYQVFLDNCDIAENGTADYYGFLSWKFFVKTQLRGTDLYAAMGEAEDADVFFINPYETSVAGLYKSVWSQLESVYPGVIPVVQHCLNEAGYNLEISSMIMSKSQMAFCNYWLGTKLFWKEYMTFTRPLYSYLEYALEEKMRTYFVKLDRKNRLGLYPHIMERMFSTFLVVRQGQFKVVRIPLPASIQEIDSSVIAACNRVKAEMMAGADGRTAQTVLDAQDVMLSRLLKYKQSSENAAKKRSVSKWMSAVAEKIGL